MGAIEIRGLSKSFRASGTKPVAAIHDVSLDIQEGEFLVLLGQSGSGKTTLLRCLAGLEEPSRGEIRLFGDTVFSSERGIAVPAEQRRVGMVFQSFGIWPHMSVVENVCLPLTDGRAHLSRKAARDKALVALEQVGMHRLADRSAALLSGGQQQRVALARALAVDPQLLLMDEPLSNLDAQLRETVRAEIRRLTRHLRTTVVYVTHDRVEAMALADRIVILDEGRIVQLGLPEETYRHPATPRVADFLGAVNWFSGVVAQDGAVETAIGVLRGVCHEIPVGSRVLTGIRPENVELTDGAQPLGENTFATRVEDVMFLGEYSLYQLERDGHSVVVRSLAHVPGRDTLWITLPSTSIMVYDAEAAPAASLGPRSELGEPMA